MIKKKILIMTLVISLLFSVIMPIFGMTAAAERVGLTGPSQVSEGDDFTVSAAVDSYFYFNGQTGRGYSWTFDAPFISGGNDERPVTAESVADGSQESYNIIILDDATISISSISPNPVFENAIFTISVVDEKGGAIEDAWVTVNEHGSKQTNRWGSVSFLANEVDADTDYLLAASKNHYTGDGNTGSITVKNKKLVFAGLPPFVDENADFDVYVKDQDGAPVENAIVSFGGYTDWTDSDGKADLTAPEVDGDTNVSISAWKASYDSANGVILVHDLDDIPAYIHVTVRNQSSGEVIVGAFVSGGGAFNTTKQNGKCTLKVFPQEYGSDYVVTASASGYKSGTADVEDVFPGDHRHITISLMPGDDDDDDSSSSSSSSSSASSQASSSSASSAEVSEQTSSEAVSGMDAIGESLGMTEEAMSGSVNIEQDQSATGSQQGI
jgi:hypothetical protein